MSDAHYFGNFRETKIQVYHALRGANNPCIKEMSEKYRVPRKFHVC